MIPTCQVYFFQKKFFKNFFGKFKIKFRASTGVLHNESGEGRSRYDIQLQWPERLIKVLSCNIDAIVFYAITTIHNLLIHIKNAKPHVRDHQGTAFSRFVLTQAWNTALGAIAQMVTLLQKKNNVISGHLYRLSYCLGKGTTIPKHKCSRPIQPLSWSISWIKSIWKGLKFYKNYNLKKIKLLWTTSIDESALGKQGRKTPCSTLADLSTRQSLELALATTNRPESVDDEKLVGCGD